MEPCSPQEDQDLSEALAASRAAFQAGSVEAWCLAKKNEQPIYDGDL